MSPLPPRSPTGTEIVPENKSPPPKNLWKTLCSPQFPADWMRWTGVKLKFILLLIMGHSCSKQGLHFVKCASINTNLSYCHNWIREINSLNNVTRINSVILVKFKVLQSWTKIAGTLEHNSVFFLDIQFPSSPPHLSMLCCCERDEQTASRIMSDYNSFNGQDCSCPGQVHRHTFKEAPFDSARMLQELREFFFYKTLAKHGVGKTSESFCCATSQYAELPIFASWNQGKLWRFSSQIRQICITCNIFDRKFLQSGRFKIVKLVCPDQLIFRESPAERDVSLQETFWFQEI